MSFEVSPYREALAFSGKAPRLEAGWRALLSALAENGPMTRPECIAVITSTGLADRTARNMMSEAVHTHNLRRIDGQYERSENQ